MGEFLETARFSIRAESRSVGDSSSLETIIVSERIRGFHGSRDIGQLRNRPLASDAKLSNPPPLHR